jgi:alpha-ketoglutaric semialdehyde dehydrogenase
MPIAESRSHQAETSALKGRCIIGFSLAASNGPTFRAFAPETGKPCEPEFISASDEDVERAVALAVNAAAEWRNVPNHTRAEFLRAVASGLEASAEVIIARAHLESGLPMGRLKGEMARTANQLRFFAEVVSEGSWVMARIDRAEASRTPIPKPDIRSMLRPLGPVAVFGASNFPLAFSVAGGDSASAWASGNPIIVKAHPAHPGTGELVGQVISRAVRSLKLPEGLFSLLFDSGIAVGQSLVKHPQVKAVGFTGSLAGGRAIMDLAASRPDPIPVFAEMGSINPVFILPRALEARGEQIVSGLYGSFTIGGGQYCTKPGVVFLPKSRAAEDFARQLEGQVSAASPFTLLTAGIQKAFLRGRDERMKSPGLRSVVAQNGSSQDGSYRVGPAIMQTDAETFLRNAELSDELFGPATLLVSHSQKAQAIEAASKLKGHLTATIHGTAEDFREFSDLIEILQTKVGRLIFNGYPTGLEVCHAVEHGGPYPATSDGRSTSVGSAAILRFCRPVCFQDCPDEFLPAELKDANPLGIWRMLDGKLTHDKVPGAQG